MNDLSSTEVIVLIVVGTVTACVSYRALRGNSMLKSPGISVFAGVLSALGFRQMSASWIKLVLDEYAVLSISIILLCLWMFLRSKSRQDAKPTSNEITCLDTKRTPSKSSETPEIRKNHQKDMHIKRPISGKAGE